MWWIGTGAHSQPHVEVIHSTISQKWIRPRVCSHFIGQDVYLLLLHGKGQQECWLARSSHLTLKHRYFEVATMGWWCMYRPPKLLSTKLPQRSTHAFETKRIQAYHHIFALSKANILTGEVLIQCLAFSPVTTATSRFIVECWSLCQHVSRSCSSLQRTIKPCNHHTSLVTFLWNQFRLSVPLSHSQRTTNTLCNL